MTGVRSPSDRAAARAREEGSTLPLIAVFGALALVLVLVVAAATSLYLERKRLLGLADGAALVGAESFRLDEVAAGPSGIRPRLDDVEVRDVVAGYLADQPADGFHALRLVRAGSADGRSAEVTVAARWEPPVLTVFVPDGIAIEATARARSVFR